MSDEITQLKAELNDMNMKCQLARDNEVRFALQRGRLEAERTQLLVKMIEAMAPTAAPVAASSPVTAPGPYLITMTGRNCAADDGVSINALREATAAPRPAPSRARPARKQKHSVKPAGLLPTADLILAVLEGAGWQRTHQITRAIQDQGWKSATSRDIGPVVWRMGRDGQLERSEQHGYRLPAARPVGGHAIGNGATV